MDEFRKITRDLKPFKKPTVLEELEILQAIRLGKIDASKPRPLKIRLDSAELVGDLLRSNKDLPENVSFSKDQTPLEREEIKELRARLVEKQKTDPHATIKYKRGKPKIISGTQASSQQEN